MPWRRSLKPKMEVYRGIGDSIMTSSCCSTSTGCHSHPAASSVHPNKRNFIEGVSLIFESWTAYRLAVQMEFAGEDTLEKAEWFRKVIVDHFDAGI